MSYMTDRSSKQERILFYVREDIPYKRLYSKLNLADDIDGIFVNINSAMAFFNNLQSIFDPQLKY